MSVVHFTITLAPLSERETMTHKKKLLTLMASVIFLMAANVSARAELTSLDAMQIDEIFVEPFRNLSNLGEGVVFYRAH